MLSPSAIQRRRGLGRHGDADRPFVLGLRRAGQGDQPERRHGSDSFEMQHDFPPS